MKSLLSDLITNGLGEFQDVIHQLDGGVLGSRELTELSGSLPVDVLRAASRDWFGRDFMSDVEAYRQGVSGEPVGADLAATKPQPDAEEVEIEDIEDEAWMQVGGWYRSNGDFTIRYRPRGHGDAFMKSWIDITAQDAMQSPAAHAVLEDFSDRKNSPGLCMKCHSIEQVADKKMKPFYRVHWQGDAQQGNKQSFTRFEHSSHLNLIKDKGCMTCHAMNDNADFKQAYSGFDASKFDSNFLPIKKSTCIQCHQSGRVNESCTTCHKYHIGDFFTSEARMKDIHTKLVKDTK
jgi:nitrate/TMAO reductase-like tetraheme cytochrome c subunit